MRYKFPSGDSNPAKRADVKAKIGAKTSVNMKRYFAENPDASNNVKNFRKTGKDHWNWKGGITPIREKIRKMPEYKLWRTAVFERDDYTCQICGKRGVRLEVDHYPKKYSHILDDNKLTSLKEARVCGELWSVNNGRALCYSCHRVTVKTGVKIASKSESDLWADIPFVGGIKLVAGYREPQNPGLGGLDELTNAEELFIQNLVGLTYARGDILYHDGNNLTNLGPGNSGEFLKTQGGGANPIWAAIAGGGDVTGPGSSTDNAIVRFDGTTGKTIQDYTSDAPTISDTGDMVMSGDISGVESLTAKIWVGGPEDSQSITAVSDTITANTATHFDLSSDADYVMTSTPTIANGIDGQIIYIHNVGNFTIAFQDEGALANTDILLNGADGVLRPDAVMTLLYDTATGGWHVVSNPNSSVAGANADTIAVRNTSGSAIAAGKVVYVTGFNVGQGRPTIALADADDANKMPAIGITSAVISNGGNGDVISFGSAIGLINTSGASVNDGVWVSTTAGEVVFTRPTVDAIQRIGTVDRSANPGNILVTGAGRTNDVPINFTANDVAFSDIDCSGTFRLDPDNGLWFDGSAGNVGMNFASANNSLDFWALNSSTSTYHFYEGDGSFYADFNFNAYTANRLITWRDAAGTVILSGDTFTGDVTGTLDADGSTALTIQATQAGITSAANLVTVGALASGSIATGFGEIQLTENKAIKLDALLSADAKWSGITTSGVSGVTTLAIGDLIYLNANDGRWELVDANLLDGYDKQLGIALTVAADGAALEVLLYGKVRSAVFPVFTVGSPLYMSETAGDVTHTAPTTTDNAIRIVGFALTAEDMMFNPSNDYITHV